ncbi:serine/threonine protein kinase, partial [Vibrio parahaemolyticus]|nr:serine/threonine protein kinase [Vibrio parahaemolyticus]
SDVYWVIRRATRSVAKLRYSDVRALRIDIERMLERRPIEQKKHWPLYSALRLVQRRPLAAALSAILVLSGVLFGNALIQKN